MRRSAAAPSARLRERIIDGLGVSLGIAIGPAHVMEAGFVDIPEYTIDENKIPAELERFKDAVEKSQRQMRKLKTESRRSARAPRRKNSASCWTRICRCCPAPGWCAASRSASPRPHATPKPPCRPRSPPWPTASSSSNDTYLAARADDVREVGDRLIRNLTKTPFQAFSQLPEGSIIIAEELTPADTALLDPAASAASRPSSAAPKGHTAIMARSLGLPAVLGLAGLMLGSAGPATR